MKAKIKYAMSLACIVIVLFLLSGCNFRFASSINDLISPLSPFGDNADVKEALDAYATNGYSLKTPNGGKYITSYSFFDVDGEGDDEAIAFYEPSDNLGTIDMAVIKKADDKKWKVVQNIQGEGKDVHSLDFGDVNDDGKQEILVCWDVISNSTNHEFTVYAYYPEKEKGIVRLDEPITVNNYILADMNGNGNLEMLLFEIDSGKSSGAKAELYTIRNNRFRLMGETKLDAHITAYTELKTEEAEGDVRVYADAIGADGSSMLTEVIYLSRGYGTIVSPFYSYATGLTKDTSRHAMITCRDVNGDGLIEIPNDKKLKKLPKEVSCVDWKIYKNTILMHTDYTLFVKRDRYLVTVPKDMIDKISVSYDGESRLMTVKSKASKKEIFSVMPVLKATYETKDYAGFQSILEASGYYYLARTGDADDMKINIDDLKSYIKSTD